MAKTSRASANLALEQVGEHEWRFLYPRLDEAAAYDALDAAVEMMDAGEYREAILPLRKLVKQFPEFIDARHHLAICLREWDLAVELVASREWHLAVDTGLGALPPKFVIGRDLLEWGWTENRPFLRAYNGLAFDALRRGETGEALAIWQDLLDLNPNDNQGIRSAIVNGFFARRRPAEALAVCDCYPDDAMPALLYGRVLALLMLDRVDEAAEHLAEAARFAPRVARELTKKNHPAPRDLDPRYVTMGGSDEAYYYWRDSGEFWKRTPGALAFVRETLGVKEAQA